MSVSQPNLPQTLPAAHALIRQLHWQVEQLKKELYGPSADRADLPPTYTQEQSLFHLFPPPSEPPATREVTLPDAPEESAGSKRPRRHPEIQALETEIQRLEPADKTCEHCGQEKCVIGCEKSERIEYVPARLKRQIIERPKLACPCGQGRVSIAPLPPSVIEKGLPGPGLLAQVVLSKFEDHLPLYRQQQQFARLGVILPRTTLCDWVEKCAELLQPLVRVMKQELTGGDYLQVDETPVRVLDPDVQGKCATGFLWVAGRPGGNVIFEFKPRRDKASALELSGSFSGRLQRDGYGVYGSIVQDRPDILPLGCLAHGRRKFVDALKDEPKQAEWFVGEIRKLYLIEKHARDHQLDPNQRKDLRYKLATPIWAGMTVRLRELRADPQRYLPASPMAKALNYAHSEWTAWQAYLADGILEIDNNLTENAIRPSALGKNYAQLLVMRRGRA